jgi:hypothetical protein
MRIYKKNLLGLKRMTSIIHKIKKHWGLSIFLTLAIFGTLKVIMENPLSEHYRIFTTAGRMLWDKTNPYGFDFHSVGLWFYSQTCGMFFFSLFAYLPPMLGLSLYSTFSVFIFMHASNKFADWSGLGANTQWYYFFSSIAIYQALIAAKVETIMISILMICIPIFFEKSNRQNLRSLLAPFFSGMVLVWKFQPAPILGLLAPILIFRMKKIQPLILLGLSIGFWHFLPMTWLGADLFNLFLKTQNETLSSFIPRDFLLFDHFYKFLNAIHITLTLYQYLMIGFVFASLSIIKVMVCLFKKETLVEMVTLATALGSIFIIAFSPLSQNNGSIFWVPALVYGLVQSQKSDIKPLFRKFMFFCFFVFVFAYSDLIPQDLRIWLRSYSIKSVLLVLLGLIWIFKPIQNTKPESAQP